MRPKIIFADAGAVQTAIYISGEMLEECTDLDSMLHGPRLFCQSCGEKRVNSPCLFCQHNKIAPVVCRFCGKKECKYPVMFYKNNPKITFYNLPDPNLIGQFLESDNGKDVFLSVLKNNTEEIKNILFSENNK